MLYKEGPQQDELGNEGSRPIPQHMALQCSSGVVLSQEGSTGTCVEKVSETNPRLTKLANHQCCHSLTKSHQDH